MFALFFCFVLLFIPHQGLFYELSKAAKANANRPAFQNEEKRFVSTYITSFLHLHSNKKSLLMNLVCMIFFLSFSLPTRWKGEIWSYSISRKYRTRLEPNWHWFGRSCKVPGCLWRQARLPPICRDTLWHPGGRRNAGWGEVSECKLVCLCFNSTPTSWSASQWCRFVFFFLCAAPGGTLSDDMTRTDYCLFTAQEDLETMQAYAQVYSTWSPEGLVVLRENGAKHWIYFKHFSLSCSQTDPQASL